MAYQVPDDVLEDARPQNVVHPLAMLIAALVGGALVGSLWAAWNARALGCRDAGKQRMVLLLGWIGVAAVALVAKSLGDAAAPEDLMHLVAEILRAVAFLGVLGVFIYIEDRQTVLYRLHVRGQNRMAKNILFAVVAILVSILIGSALPEGSIWRSLWLAGAI